MASSFPYVGNGATGIVHRKNSGHGACRVAEIKQANRENFATLDDALTQKRGRRKKYRACKLCCS